TAALLNSRQARRARRQTASRAVLPGRLAVMRAKNAVKLRVTAKTCSARYVDQTAGSAFQKLQETIHAQLISVIYERHSKLAFEQPCQVAQTHPELFGKRRTAYGRIEHQAVHRP